MRTKRCLSLVEYVAREEGLPLLLEISFPSRDVASPLSPPFRHAFLPLLTVQAVAKLRSTTQDPNEARTLLRLPSVAVAWASVSE